MFYIRHSNFEKFKFKNVSLYLDKEIQGEKHAQISQHALNDFSDLEKRRALDVVECHDKSKFIFKTNLLNHRNKRLRTTVGIKRRGSYDKSAAEIYNHLKLRDKEYIPKIFGYGYERGKSGLITKTIFIAEFKSDTYNVREFLDLYPEKINQTLFLSFDLIEKHISDGLLHLDLWLGNVIVNKDLSSSWLVDLEIFKLHSSRPYYEKMSHSLGNFFSHTLCSYIDLDSYINLISIWHKTSKSTLCLEKLIESLTVKPNTNKSTKDIMRYF